VSPLVAAGLVLAFLLALAFACRRPLLAGVTGGLFVGPLCYYWIGIHLASAHGEGHFYSFPFGGYRLRDANVLLSAGVWVLAAGFLAYAAARVRRPRTP